MRFIPFACAAGVLGLITTLETASVRASLPPLNATASNVSSPGKFEWADLITGNVNSAEQFYTGLLGWTATGPQTPQGYGSEHSDARHSYVVLYSNGVPVAGIVGRTGGASDRPGRWIPYIAVSSIDTTVHEISTLNCRIVSHVRDVPDRGRQAVIQDPEGAVIGLLQSTSGDLADQPVANDGWAWFELFSSNPKDASSFYKQAFLYGFEPSSSGEANHYVLTVGDRAVAGIESLPPGVPNATADWVGFVRVTGLDGVLNKVQQLGGSVIEPAQNGADNSRFALVSDPTGAVFGVVEFSNGSAPANGAPATTTTSTTTTSQ